MKTKNEKTLDLKVSEEELKLILEAMIFFASVDTISHVPSNEAARLYESIESLYNKLKPIKLDVSIYGTRKTFETKEISIKLKRLLK